MSKKILIVDDDLESLKLVGLMLQRRGYEIIAANDGLQALTKVEAEKPDLVILDVMMPDLDGYQVCHQLRSDPATADVPVIMFTAKTLVGDKVAGFQAGADDYLTKPIHPSELVERVDTLLERAEEARAEARSLPRARVVGIIGAKGGVGTSTLAVNLALVAARNQSPGQYPPDQIILVDLQVSGGTVALLLGEPPQAGWANLIAQDAEDLSQEIISGQTSIHSSGLHYLPGLLEADDQRSHLPRAHVEAVMDRLRTAFDRLYLDLGSGLGETTRHAIAFCDVLLIVVEPERLCLTLARSLLDRLRRLEAGPEEVRLVAVQRSPTDGHPSSEEIEAELGHELAAFIEPAPAAMRRAVEAGKPLVLLDPENEVSGQLRTLGRTLLG